MEYPGWVGLGGLMMTVLKAEYCAFLCRFIELDEGETIESVTQHDIVQAVDVTSAQKVCFTAGFSFFG